MLSSMTGFGAGRARVGAEEVSVELKSVNHKFAEVKVRLPRELAALESTVAKAVKDKLARGAIEVFVRRESSAGAERVPAVDVALLHEYRKAFTRISEELGLPNEVRLIELAAQPGVIRLEEPGVDLPSAQQAALAALDQAIAALVAMRAKEGQALEEDLLDRLSTIERWSQEVAQLSPRSVEEFRERLKARIAEIAAGQPVEPQRLAQEVAYFAERTDVAEEVTRLHSHLGQFRALIAAQEPSGRRMDFLVQEMHREVNTTGSKSSSAEISTRIVALKAELERVREQVQNVE